MKWLFNISTRSKLIIGFGLLIILSVASIMAAYARIKALEQSQKKLFEVDFANSEDLFLIQVHENGVRAAVLHMLLLKKRADQEVWHQDIEKRSKHIDSAIAALLDRNRNNPQFLSKL